MLFENTFWTKPYQVHENSAAMIADLVAQTKITLKPAFNYKKFTTRIYYVDSKTPLVPVTVTNKTGSTLHKHFQKGVPIPADAEASAGTDMHLTIINKETWQLWEFWKFTRINGKCACSWGGYIPDIRIFGVVPPMVNASGKLEMTGATATSLPVSAGMILPEELKAGKIGHMIAMALPNPAPRFVPPALRTDGNTTTSTGLIPAGQIFRFPPNVFINPKWSPFIQMLVVAGRDHGFIVRDKSGCISLYGLDVTQYKYPVDPYLEFFGGRAGYKILEQMPWGALEAVK